MSKNTKPLSKRTRFEVFKRDGFKCVYCGAQVKYFYGVLRRLEAETEPME